MLQFLHGVNTPHCSLLKAIQVSCETSNLSLDRNLTGGKTNSREIQMGYDHLSATLYT
jgi:hypothetical protein